MFKKVSEQDQVIINVIDQALAADMEPEKVAEFIEQVAASVWMFPPSFSFQFVTSVRWYRMFTGNISKV
jgi:hypothetical protein